MTTKNALQEWDTIEGTSEVSDAVRLSTLLRELRQAPHQGTKLNSVTQKSDDKDHEEKKAVGQEPCDSAGGNYKPPQPVSQPALKMPRLIGRTGKLGASKPIKAWLTYYAKPAGAANTAFAFQFALQPNLDASFASWQQVFDEMKVLAAEIKWNANYTTIPTAFPAQSPNAAVAYDPEYTGVIFPTAVNSVLEYESYQLLNVSSINNGAFSQSVNPQALSQGGHLTFKCRVPQSGGSQSTSATTLSTGMWRPTMDAANYYWGSIIGYCAQGGTSSVIQIEGFVRMLVEFRTRR